MLDVIVQNHKADFLCSLAFLVIKLIELLCDAKDNLDISVNCELLLNWFIGSFDCGLCLNSKFKYESKGN